MTTPTGEFTLNDFLQQMQQIARLGGRRSIMRLITGAKKFDTPDLQSDVKRLEGMIRAMTPDERTSPGIIDHNRRCRIAAGSGNRVRDVILLLRDFEKMKRMMTELAEMPITERMRRIRDWPDMWAGDDPPDRNARW